VQDGWQFCPYCGVDNRPPESRSAVPAHQHDFTKGYHCIYCGSSNQAQVRPAPDRGFRYRNYNVNSGIWTVALILAIIAIPRHHSYTGRYAAYGIELRFLGAVFAVALLGILFRQFTVVSPARREVREELGFWPFHSSTVYRFEDCRKVVCGTRFLCGRTSRMAFQISLALSDASLVTVNEFSYPGSAFTEGQQIAGLIGIPFENDAGFSY
jgi:hypothetical protein